MIKTLLY